MTWPCALLPRLPPGSFHHGPTSVSQGPPAAGWFPRTSSQTLNPTWHPHPVCAGDSLSPLLPSSVTHLAPSQGAACPAEVAPHSCPSVKSGPRRHVRVGVWVCGGGGGLRMRTMGRSLLSSGHSCRGRAPSPAPAPQGSDRGFSHWSRAGLGWKADEETLHPLRGPPAWQPESPGGCSMTPPHPGTPTRSPGGPGPGPMPQTRPPRGGRGEA